MRDNKNLVSTLFFIVALMCVVVYASVPLYSLFCKVTGYGGTPKIIAGNLKSKQKGNKIIIRFDANIDKNLNWKFYPKQKDIEIKTGDTSLVFYMAENLSNKKLTGTAVYNVTPSQAGQYFNKIECFCFENQTLFPGQKIEMPVSFFIDPDIEKDPELKGVDTITLSYSFFKIKEN